MNKSVRVHHFVANLVTRQYGAHTSDLLGLDYWHEVPADTEFPRTLVRMDLFTRFYLDQAKPTEFFLRVWWLNHPTESEQMIGQFGPFRVNFSPDVFVRDYAFHLRHVRLQGVGLHKVELLREAKRGWRKGDLVAVGITHFAVER